MLVTQTKFIRLIIMLYITSHSSDNVSRKRKYGANEKKKVCHVSTILTPLFQKIIYFHINIYLKR